MAQLAAVAAAATAHPALVVAVEGPAASARAARPERPLLSLSAVGALRCGVVSSRGGPQSGVLFRRQRAVVVAAVQPQGAARVVGAAAVEAARRRSGRGRPSGPGRWRSSRASSWPSLACAASMTSSARRHCSLAASGGALMGTGQPRRARQLCEGSAGACHNGEMRNAGLIFPALSRAPRAVEGRLSSTKPFTTPAAETREMISQRARGGERCTRRRGQRRAASSTYIGRALHTAACAQRVGLPLVPISSVEQSHQ